MNEPNFEYNSKREYFETISSQLDTLITNIKAISLVDEDYEMLSGKATSEVNDYIQRGLIVPLTEAKSRLGIEDEQPEAAEEKVPMKSGMQKVMKFSMPLQEIFASLKEVVLLDPEHYDQLIRKHSDAVELLTNLMINIEEGRIRKIAK